MALVNNNKLVLHCSPENKNASIALITAAYSNIKLDLIPYSKNNIEKILPVGETQKLETTLHGDLFEIHAIARYIAVTSGPTNLLGFSLTNRLNVDQWIDFSMTHLDAAFTSLCKARCATTVIDDDSGVNLNRCDYLKKSLQLLNTHLAAKKFYLVGNSLSLADIITTCTLSFGFTMLLVKKYTSNFPHVERYFWQMVKLPNFKNILGDVKQIKVWTKLTMPTEEVAEPSNKTTSDD